jgi:hypothetical protein
MGQKKKRIAGFGDTSGTITGSNNETAAIWTQAKTHADEGLSGIEADVVRRGDTFDKTSLSKSLGKVDKAHSLMSAHVDSSVNLKASRDVARVVEKAGHNVESFIAKKPNAGKPDEKPGVPSKPKDPGIVLPSPGKVTPVVDKVGVDKGNKAPALNEKALKKY